MATTDIGAALAQNPLPPIAAPSARPLPVNISDPIDCTLPGYEGITLRFVTSRSRAQLAQVEKNGDDLDVLAFIIAAVDAWPFACAPPVPGDKASFEACEALGMDLIAWIPRVGFREALKATLSKN